MLIIIADTGYANGRQLPQVLVIHLGYRDIVLVP